MSLQGLIDACQLTIQKIDEAQGQILSAGNAIREAAETASMTLSAQGTASAISTAVQLRLGDVDPGAGHHMDEGARMANAAKELLETYIAGLLAMGGE